MASIFAATTFCRSAVGGGNVSLFFNSQYSLFEELAGKMRKGVEMTWPGVQFCAGHGFSCSPLADQAEAAKGPPSNIIIIISVHE